MRVLVQQLEEQYEQPTVGGMGIDVGSGLEGVSGMTLIAGIGI